MNVQTIQIVILLLDGVIKMAPWQAGTTGRNGAGKNLAQSFRLAVTVLAGF